MFFIGIMGIGSKAEATAQNPQVICPVCGKESKFHLSHTYDYFHFFFIPLIKYKHRAIATCGNCASAFEAPYEAVPTAKGVRLDSSQLQLLRRGQPGQCPHCGKANPSGSIFCNNCGNRLNA